MPGVGGHAIERGRVASPARRGDSFARRLATLGLMRVVTGRAQQLAAAPLKAGGAAQAVRGTDDFEFVVVAGAGRMVEIQFEVAERFSGPIRERRSAEGFLNLQFTRDPRGQDEYMIKSPELPGETIRAGSMI